MRFQFRNRLFLVALAAAPPAAAREYAPRVLAPSTADAYSMKPFAEFPRWRDLKDDARAWEVYRYLADPRTGLDALKALTGHGVKP